MMRKAVVALTPLLFLVASQVFALGLGTLTLESSLNQPLRARIEIIDLGGVSPGDITVQLASPQDFNRFNAQRIGFLTDIRFEVERTPSGVYVNLRSSQPVREPYLNLILDTRWPSGRILSEHTVLLDLPAFSDAQSLAEPVSQPVAQPQAPASQPQSTAQTPAPVTPAPIAEPELAAPVEPAPELQAEPEQLVETPEPEPAQPQPASQPAPQPDALEILESDTLWEIALRVRPDNTVSVQQTMLAIQRINPQAFPDGNINRLRAGEVLRVPDLSDILSLDQQQAVAEVSRQNQQASIGAEPLAAPASGPQTTSSGQQGQLRVLTTEDAEPVAPDAGGELVQENAELDARIQALENQLALQEEEADRANLQRQELISRLADLETQIASAMELISLQDQQLAQLQESLATATEEAAQQAESNAQTAAAAAAGAQQPRSLMDNIIAALSNSTTILIAVALVVVLLMVIMLKRRNRAVTAEGFETDLADELNADHDDVDTLRGRRFDDLDEPDSDGDFELPPGAAIAMGESTGRDTDDDQHTRIDLGVPVAGRNLGDDADETDEDSQDADEAARQDDPGEGEERDDIVDFDLGSPAAKAAAATAAAGIAAAAAAAGDTDEADQDDSEDEIVDFDLDEFLDQDDEDSDADQDAADSDSDIELELTGDEDTDPGPAAKDTESLAEAGPEDAAVRQHDANEEYEDREYGSVDFDLSDAGIAKAEPTEERADDEEPDTGSVDAFDFDLTEEIDSTEASDSAEDKPESIEFEPESAAAGPSQAAADIDVPLGSDESGLDHHEAIDFDVETGTEPGLDADMDATAALDEIDDDEEADAVEGPVEFDVGEGTEEIEIELDDDDADLSANDEIEFEDVLDDELSEEDMDSTGIDFDLSAANEAVEEAASEEIEEIEDIEFSDDEDSDDIAEVIDEDKAAADEDAAIELENLDFLSPEKDSAADGADDDIDFLSDDDEAATKLDLAYAYKKMGDMDGAREILEEVLKEGNQSQVTEARSLMEALVK